MLDRETFQNKDLVLTVAPSCDPKKFDPTKYEDFLDALCGNREYQKEAIREATRYFLSGEYGCLKELAEQNYNNNPKLQEKYFSFEELLNHLQLPSALSCSLDHATATGKSYVMYGIARILLAEGAIDQALVLCPSNTIETGLTEKFRALSKDAALKDLLPENSQVLNPRIINASDTIQKGDICVENIHATYLHTKSAIEDSLIGKGNRTLVLNDEAHHLMNASNAALKKWKEFLLDPKYGFKYIINVSGTCYIGNDYFADVIHRFSLRDSMEAKFVKLIRYVAEDSSGSEDEKFQKIYDNHIENKTVKYRKLKPITILITKDISACEKVTAKLIDFLAKKEHTSREDAEKSVLIVTSAPKHKNNIPTLYSVDENENPIEWITSVSMLTEGWDVKNVFQIVPHEQRAFNSKLLIAQVLGRGLRIPETYKGEQPIVTVFNHDKWSNSIKHLVDEVLEIEKRIHSRPLIKSDDYNFDLESIQYKRVEEEVEYSQEKQYQLLSKGFISYSSQAQVVEKPTKYVKSISEQQDVKMTAIEFAMHSIDTVANEVINKLKIIDMDLGTSYSNEFSVEKVKKIVKESLKKIGETSDLVSESNLQKTLQAFGVVYRKKAKSLRITIDAQDVIKINTRDAKPSSLGVGSLRRDSTIFWNDDSMVFGDLIDIKLLKELDADGSLRRDAWIKVTNKYNFKTPANIVFAASTPERKFVQGLTDDQTAKTINCWIKSPDVGFYSLEYSWRKGEHPKQGSFNPDFFINMGEAVVVVEIKTNTDVTNENKAKLRYAKEHFARLNDRQTGKKYFFNFLSPISYDAFFDALRNKTYAQFKSELEVKLEELSTGE
jgi:type III restriction enzyme